jgi:O-antigen/teichoic acid export membrane protein
VGTNLALLGLLMPVIGLLGAAIAMTASFAISSALLVIAFRRYGGMSLSTMWRYQRSDSAVLFEAARGIRAKLRGAIAGGD